MTKVNRDILRKCRLNMALSLSEVNKKVEGIRGFEGRFEKDRWVKLPIDLIDKLADLYEVPRWVFLEKKLPKEYDYKFENVVVCAR